MKNVKIKNSFFLLSLLIFLISCNHDNSKNNKKENFDNNYRILLLKNLDSNKLLDTIKIINSNDLEKLNGTKIKISFDNNKHIEYLFPANSEYKFDFHFISEEFQKKEILEGNKFDFGIWLSICNGGCDGEYTFSFKNNNLILNTFKYKKWKSILWSIDNKKGLNIEENIERKVTLDSILSKKFNSDCLNYIIENGT